MTRQLQDAVNDRRVNRLVSEVSNHASLQNRVAKFHSKLLNKLTIAFKSITLKELENKTIHTFGVDCLFCHVTI